MYFKKSIDFLKHETFGIVIFYETKPVFLGLSGMQHVLWADQFETSTSPPPGHTPGIWLCIASREGGIWTLHWKGGEFEPDLSLVLT